MARPPRDGSGSPAPWPGPRAPWPSFYLSGSSCGSTSALTAPRTWSVHGRCATDGRRGTDPLVGHRSAHRVKAGVRTLSGRRADGGPRAGDGAGEATPAHAPARPLWSMGRRGGTASTRPVGTAPHPRAESADTSLTARPAARKRPRPGGPVSRLPGNLPPTPCSVRGPRRALACAGTGTVHARKGTVGMTSLVSQRSTRQTPRTVTRQITRTLRSADLPAAPGRAVSPGQRPNIPAGVNRD